MTHAEKESAIEWLPLSSPPSRDCNVLMWFGDRRIDIDDVYALSPEMACEGRDERLELGFYKVASECGGHWFYMGTAHDVFERLYEGQPEPTLYAVIRRPA